ncbi:MAG: hypothetical protein IJH32_08945 [Ruminococcus sp.]|nr:hypothetical protein [Ruminococcus sp.]
MIKKWLGRILSVTLVICLLAAFVPMTVFAEEPELDSKNYAIKRSTFIGFWWVKDANTRLLSYATTPSKPGTTSNFLQTLTCSINTDYNNGYINQTDFFKIQNKKMSSNLALSFDYTIHIGSNGGSITFDGTSVTESGTYILGSTTEFVRVDITSGAEEGATTWIEMSNFQYVDPNTSISVTVNGSAGGRVRTSDGYVADGETIALSTTLAQGAQIQPFPADGYEFFGFVDANHNKITVDDTWMYYPTKDVTVSPVFARPGIDPVFSVGGKLFTDLGDAAAQGGVVIPLQDCTVPAGSYTIPSGTTLLVPNDSSNTVYTTQPQIVNEIDAPSAYRKLTLASGAVLNFESGSALSVGGKLFSANAGKSCSVTNTYGQVIVSNGALMNFASGTNLYAWGFVTSKAGEAKTDDAKIHLYSGATVYEDFQICDFPGGTHTLNLMQASNVFFPLSQYYIQNVECRMQIDAGAKEEIYGALYALSMNNFASMIFIGPEEGSLFKLTDGYIVKYYDETEDKVKCDIYGDATISPVQVTIAGKSIDTTLRQMPINNIGVNVKSGTLATDQAILLLPDSYINIDEGATFDIRNDVYLVDAADWIGGKHVYPSSNLRPLVYSATLADNGINGGKSPREQKGGEGSMDSAVLDVNGTVNIEANGTLVTTGSGAQIISTEGTATIVNNSEKTVSALVLATFGSEVTCSADTEIKANVLRNEDGTTIRGGSDDTYTYDAETGKWITKGFVYFDDFTLSLDGNICTVLRYEIPEETDIADYTITINDVEGTFIESGSSYKVLYPVKIAEITDTLTAKLYYNGTLKSTDEVIPAAYGRKLDPNFIANPTALVDEEDSYYLTGTFSGDSCWTVDTIRPEYLFELNIENPDDNEYMLTGIPLAKGDEIKAAKYQGGSLTNWYPDNQPNYTITETGVYNIYLRPDGNGNQDWYWTCIYVEQVTDENTIKSHLIDPLVQTTLNLGNQAQLQWNHSTDNPAYTSDYILEHPTFGAVDSAAILDKLGRQQALTVDEDVFASYGLKYAGSTLVLNDNTKIKHYFTITNQTLYNQYKDSFTFDGQAVTAKTHDGNEFYFEVGGIAAVDLDNQYVLANTKGEASLSYAALDYAVKVINRNKENEAQLRNLMYALYWYNVYADAYWA